MRSTVAVILGLVAFAAGAVLLAAHLWTDWKALLVAWWQVTSGHTTIAVVGSLLMVLPLAQVLGWWREWRRSREISYATENGRITVSLIAIEEALTRALEGESEVKRATVHVYEDRAKRAVIIEAKVTLWEVPNLTERNRFCQRLLRRRFAELMPEQTAVQVLITIYRIYQRKPEARPAGAPASAAAMTAPTAAQTKSDSEVYLPEFDDLPASEEDLYHGPSYPVARDEENESGAGSAFYGRTTGTYPAAKRT